MAKSNSAAMKSLLQQTLQDFLNNPEKGSTAELKAKYDAFKRPTGERRAEVRAQLEILEAEKDAQKAADIEAHRLHMLAENQRKREENRLKLIRRKEASLERLKQYKQQEKVKKLTKYEQALITAERVTAEKEQTQELIYIPSITTDTDNA